MPTDPAADPAALRPTLRPCGPTLRPCSQLGDLEGELVAIETTEGAAFKRIGPTLAGAPHVRFYESVGGIGESMLARSEDLEEDKFAGLPLLLAARLVLGVLYEVP